MPNILTFIFNQVNPPSGFPVWLIPVLGFVLPWLYAKIIANLSGWLKFVITTMITFGVSIIAALLAGIPLNGSIALFVWLFACTQFVYWLMTKPITKAKSKKGAV
ncbi:MAG: hypothetical protein KG012_03365 [Deltaproteobacteria bacterium]|nr:hypothetical protein [Deltaproteobacteria bacterium]